MAWIAHRNTKYEGTHRSLSPIPLPLRYLPAFSLPDGDDDDAYETLLWILAMLSLVSSAGDEGKRVPTFSGERIDFTAWFMLFSAYVAYKLVWRRRRWGQEPWSPRVDLGTHLAHHVHVVR
jgi:hypothetical protein